MAVRIKFTAIVEHGNFVVEIGPALVALLVWGQLILKPNLNSDLLTWSQQDVLRIFSRIKKSVKLDF